jgi:hypothetical protein
MLATLSVAQLAGELGRMAIMGATEGAVQLGSAVFSAPNKQVFWACSGKAWYQAGGALGPGRPGGARPMPRTV